MKKEDDGGEPRKRKHRKNIDETINTTDLSSRIFWVYEPLLRKSMSDEESDNVQKKVQQLLIDSIGNFVKEIKEETKKW